MALSFSDTIESSDTSNLNLRTIAGVEKKKTGERSPIDEKLEKVRGLTDTTKAVGGSVKEVREYFICAT